ncbi:hypothetical protein NQ317_009190 [Molorchus minor]|uniref:MARVEL domain-containing protein n=1 Tax=Molorchus minor TaxID=1323400 RepID=A0ABQ9JPJ6_9CUCU|nr:hypothetical protein NQ317_009190 [Molorchus minor]
MRTLQDRSDGEKMGENAAAGTQQEGNKSHVTGLMRFFSVESEEMGITSGAAQGIHAATGMLSLQDLWCREFVLKVVQLMIGFVCLAIYSEGLIFLKNSINSMMFPNIVFSSFVIITSAVILSRMLGCAIPEVLIRIFSFLGLILYFAAATVILYECLNSIGEYLLDEMVFRRKLLFATSAISYFNFVVYVVDVYFSVKKAISFENNK